MSLSANKIKKIFNIILLCLMAAYIALICVMSVISMLDTTAWWQLDFWQSAGIILWFTCPLFIAAEATILLIKETIVFIMERKKVRFIICVSTLASIMIGLLLFLIAIN